MATRSSRRSSGRDTFNPAMIHLLDADRLRKELESRGLDTTGNRSVLADRLQEAVDREKSSRHGYSPPPIAEKPVSKRVAKRVSKAEAKGVGQVESSSGAGSVKRKRLTASSNEPVEVIEESFSIQISEDTDFSITQSKNVEDDSENVPISNEETSDISFASKETVKLPPKKSLKKLTGVEKIHKRPDPGYYEGIESRETGLQLTVSAEKPFGIKIKKIEVPSSEVRKESHLKATVGIGTSKKRMEKHAEKISEKADSEKSFNSKDLTNESSEDCSGKRYVKVDEEDMHEKAFSKDDSKQNKGLKLKLKLEHDKEPHPGTSLEKKDLRKVSDANPRKSSDGSLEIVSDVVKRKLSKQGSVEKAKDGTLSNEGDKKIETEKKKDTIVRKKIPLRMQAVDVFDTIFDKQTELLSSKFKSEEERAAERQKIELAKRRQSSTQLPIVSPPPAPMEKRRHTVEFNLSPQVFPNRSRLPPPPPPPLPSRGEAYFDSYRMSSTQRRLTPPPPPPLPKRKGVSFDEKPLSVILPAPPPPPVILAPLPPPPPPPRPDILPAPLISSEAKVPLARPDVAVSNLVDSSPSLSTALTTPGVSSSSLVRSSLSSPVLPKSSSSGHSSPSKRMSNSPVLSSSLSEPTTSSLTPQETGNSYSQVERHAELPLQQIAKALCSVFAHIGSKSQELENCPETNELDTDDFSTKASEVSSVVSVTLETVDEDSLAVEEFEKKTAEFKDSNSVEVQQSLKDIVDEVVKAIDNEKSRSVQSENETVGVATAQSSLESINDLSDEAQIFADSRERKEMETDSSNSKDFSAVPYEKEVRNEEKPNICEALMRDPLWLLRKASDIIKNLDSQDTVAAAAEEPARQYEQISPGPDYEAGDEEKPLPAFYGEPVPDDDDIVIEGSKRKSNMRKNVVQEEEPIPGDENVEIDFYNADLHIKANETNSFLIDPDNGDGFALMWGGARSNFGIKVPEITRDFPKVVFQAKIKEFLPIIHLPFEELDPHDIRIGWSLGSTGNILGESSHSFAYSSLARKAVNSVFTDYGEPFHINDVITAVLDLGKNEISYYKSEEFLGVAFSDLRLSPGDVIFPHICTKNCKVEVNFGDGDSASWLSLDLLKSRISDDGTVKFMNSLDRKFLVRGPVAPPSKSDCTVLMMVGLPGVGKSTWVRQYLRDHPHEQWTLLSTDIIISAMKVNGIARSRVHQGRWDMIMGLTAKAMNRSLHLACRRRRNYIIDQTNVSREARRRKLSQFKDFQRKCVVIIPSEEEMLSRQARQVRVDGVSATPVEAMLELKASFAIPNIENEPIEGVYFVEPPLERIGEAIELVNRFNEEARPWCQKKRGRRGEGRSNGNSGDYSRSGERTLNSYFQKTATQASSDVTSPAVNCDSAGETPQSSAQPSPNIISRPNEGYCGFNGAVPPSLHSAMDTNGLVPVPLMDPTVPPPNAWAERKHSFA